MRGLVSLHGAVARTLLSASPDPVMTARVAALQDSRARIIAAADAERRRLERDLHDGAQQRLVALSMQLGLAKRRLAKGEDVGDLVATADAELRAAIAELRDLARGIHPAVLTDRGLAPALRDVATRSAVPGRARASCRRSGCPGPVEAAAYFTVSEALTNVARYAHATVARVDVARARRRARDRGRRRRRRRRGRRTAARACAGSPTGSARSAASCASTPRPGAGHALRATIPLAPARAASRRRARRGATSRRAAAAGSCSRTPSSTRS